MRAGIGAGSVPSSSAVTGPKDQRAHAEGGGDVEELLRPRLLSFTTARTWEASQKLNRPEAEGWVAHRRLLTEWQIGCGGNNASSP